MMGITRQLKSIPVMVRYISNMVITKKQAVAVDRNLKAMNQEKKRNIYIDR